jgi:hypothetical protein
MPLGAGVPFRFASFITFILAAAISSPLQAAMKVKLGQS